MLKFKLDFVTTSDICQIGELKLKLKSVEINKGIIIHHVGV